MAFQGDSIFWVEVEKIVPNPFQPRREFDEARLKELSESVRMYGILQPLTVTRHEVQAEDGSFRTEYELIAGERRLRASKLAGLSQVPVIIREGEQSEQEKLELAIIENLQREDLNSVDRALAFRQLADVFGLSHVQVAAKVGRSREYVSNTIRLLALPDYMLSALRTADISEGHARTLLMLNERPEEQDTVFREILLKKLSVREVERIARNIATEKIRKKSDYDADLVALEKKFTETLGTRVSIVKTEFGGRLSIDYFTQDDLEEMLTRMKTEGKSGFAAIEPSVPGMTELGPLNEPGPLTDPRASELAILTERTGLEMVPEKNYVPIINIPTEIPPDLEVSAESSAIASTESTVADLDVAEEVVVAEPEVTPEVVAEELESVVNEESLDEVISPVAETIETVPQAVVEAEIPEPIIEEIEQVTEPEVIPEVESAAPDSYVPETAPRPSLRDQLASLLGQVPKMPVVPNEVTSPLPAQPVAVPAVVHSPVLATPGANIETPAVPAIDTDQATDDSNLYDLKNFSI